MGDGPMILCHRHRFIFLKTNKTAGTSVEIALSRFCGPTDVITPISEEDEETRRSLGYRGAQNYLVPLSKAGLREVAKAFLGRPRRKQFYHHMTAGEVKSIVGEAVWDSYFKFCVERNPWDRMISFYYWRTSDPDRPSLLDFMDSGLPDLLKTRGHDVYHLNGQVAVDRILHFERLEEELESVRLHLGLPEPLELPRAKSTSRKDKRHYREILSPEERERIADLFAAEIRLLGYEY